MARLFGFAMICGLFLASALGEEPEKAKKEYVDRMAQEHAGDEPVPSEGAKKAPEREVDTSEVAYATLEGKEVRGFLARPRGSAEGLPGVLVIQEWWGLNDNIRSMAQQLAGEGYVALAVDLYGGEVAETRDEARRLMTEAMSDREGREENLRQAVRYLQKAQGAQKVGVIGWCFGGFWSLQTALIAPQEIQASVIYYGRTETDKERLARLEAPVLGHYGAEDRGIPVESVRQLDKDLEELGKEADLHIYDGADHAFANPSGTRYAEEAAELAWERTLKFFGEHLGGK